LPPVGRLDLTFINDWSSSIPPIDLWKTWQAGMGVEVAEMEDPYLPGFGGEMPSAKQYAVNAATENKRWTLQTLIILFRSFLNLKTGSACTSLSYPVKGIKSVSLHLG
jgi:hypothetical protein